MGPAMERTLDLRLRGGALVLLALILVTCAGTAGRAAAAQVPLPIKGVAVDIIYGEDPAAELQDVDDAAAVGANAIRVSLQWSGLEPLHQGEYATWYLDRLDAVVARAHADGVRVLLTPVFTPCWAASAAGVADPCADAGAAATASHRPPADPATYGHFAAFLAARYGAALAGIEVWNEPNLSSFWDTPSPAASYAALLRATYAAVKAVSPATTVVGGALAGADAGFLSQLYAAGISGFYDALSVHPYNDGRAPDALIDQRWAAATFLQGLESIRDTRAAQGDDAPLWLTEFGWNTSTQRGQLWLDGVSPDEQASYLSQALTMLQDPASGIAIAQAAFIYRLRDWGTDPSDPQQNYGLESYDRTHKPSFAAVRSSFAQGISTRSGGQQPAPAPAVPTVSEPAPTEPPAAPAVTAPAPAPVAPAPHNTTRSTTTKPKAKPKATATGKARAAASSSCPAAGAARAAAKSNGAKARSTLTGSCKASSASPRARAARHTRAGHRRVSR
jgi:hypothetical protein